MEGENENEMENERGKKVSERYKDKERYCERNEKGKWKGGGIFVIQVISNLVCLFIFR